MLRSYIESSRFCTQKYMKSEFNLLAVPTFESKTKKTLIHSFHIAVVVFKLLRFEHHIKWIRDLH